MNTADIIVSIAQVAAGGTIVQAMVAVFRRRSELRQLDRQSDSVAVDTADQVVTMLRRELMESREELADVKQDRANLQRQVGTLSEHVSKVSADLAVARADLDRFRSSST
ncbi:hypothetical protein [Actinomadura rudentiformis]|uniref:DUF2746 domain-containing protein n=1 Tax=Actinomadura rudentiformis TaxID=359158 RepID=A0A6H9YL55_9ACTN|nr:hypothetical protein [Actinomadura rudentiformis]KAB2346451.1 hypothetical protein F8566_23605 [Actinomadura rudentiformis]